MKLGVFGRKGASKGKGMGISNWEYQTKRRVKVRIYPKRETRQGEELQLSR
jgi:hypothetical protein